MGKPLISAVIPVRNGEAYLAEAISSVLAQTHPRVECIVVDDGSTDASAEIARGFGAAVSYAYQENAGVSAARNRGAALAKGDYLGFIDHDDIWLEQRCERLLDVLEGSGASVALCAMTEVDAELNPLGVRRLEAPHDLLEGMVMFDGTTIVSCSSAALVPRSWFFELGGFDEQLGMSADWDFLARNLLRGRIEYLDEPLVLYRWHGENWSHRVEALEKDALRAFDKLFSFRGLDPLVKGKERPAYARLYRMLAGSYLDAGDRAAALRCLAASLRRHPPIAGDLMRTLGRRLYPARRPAAEDP